MVRANSIDRTLNIKHEILKSFNEQFATNQNSHQKLLVSLVSILLTVIIGFTAALMSIGQSNGGKFNVGIFEFSLALVISEFILLILIAIVSHFSVAFRRDQLVVSNIREFAGVTYSTAKTDHHKIFFDRFNPKRGYESDSN